MTEGTWGRIEAVELGDAESGSGEGSQGGAIGMTAAHKEFPERNGHVLRHASKPCGLVTYVFNQQELAVRSQNAAQLSGRLLGVVNRAHNERAHRGIEACISERQSFGCGLHDLHRHICKGNAAVKLLKVRGVGLTDDHFLHVTVVKQVHSGACADFDHLTACVSYGQSATLTEPRAFGSLVVTVIDGCIDGVGADTFVHWYTS